MTPSSCRKLRRINCIYNIPATKARVVHVVGIIRPIKKEGKVKGGAIGKKRRIKIYHKEFPVVHNYYSYLNGTDK